MTHRYKQTECSNFGVFARLIAPNRRYRQVKFGPARGGLGLVDHGFYWWFRLSITFGISLARKIGQTPCTKSTLIFCLLYFAIQFSKFSLVWLGGMMSRLALPEQHRK